MLSIHSISVQDAGGMSKYYSDLAAKDDYYSSSQDAQEKPGIWLGSGAEKLGLDGIVQEGELLKTMQGFDPRTGEALAKNAGQESHKPGWDCCFSAPKSVSTVWAVADQETRLKIEAAHMKAVEYSIGYLEREACTTRHGHAGKDHQPVTESGGLIVAAYEHSTSRNQDPQLHTHCLIMNVTPTGRSIDLDTREKMAAGSLYRAELAHQLKELGFEIEHDKNSFKIAGVSQKLVDEFSSRRAEIQAALNDKNLTSAKAASVAALDTRHAKEECSRLELFERWQATGKEHGFTAENVKQLTDKTIEKTQNLDAPARQIEPKTGEQIAIDLTQQSSTFSQQQHLTATSNDGVGFLSAAEIEERAKQHLEAAEIVALGTYHKADKEASEHIKTGERFTTVQVLETESKMIEMATKMAGRETHQTDRETVKEIAAEKGLTELQTKALEHITDASQITVLEGHAGAGKSFTLGAAREAFEDAGYEVRGAALSNAAANNLTAEAGIQSTSIAKLENSIERGEIELNSKTVLVIDESGMVSTNQMARLVEACENTGAKLVLVGDTKQLSAIDAGSPMRAIADEIGKGELSEVFRQKSQEQKEIANDFREGRAGEALQKLDDLGHLKVHERADDVLANAAKSHMADLDEGKTSLVIAGTRAEVRDLNLMVREELVSRGEVSRDSQVVQTTNGMREMATGDKVVFGEKFAFGDKNDKETTVINGSRGQVTAAEKTNEGVTLTVKLDHSDKTVQVRTQDYQKIDHGYATTVHKAQGATVDRCHVVTSERGGREQAYVAGSRHRESVTMYTTTARLEQQGVTLKDKTAEASIENSDLAKGMVKSDSKDNANDYIKAAEAKTDTKNTDRDFDR